VEDLPPEFELARKYMSAGVLFFRQGREGHVLLVNPTYKPQWEIPGGVVEEGESPYTAALREVAEELGAPLPVGRLLGLDYRDNPRFGEGLHFIFDGGELSEGQVEALELPEEELSEYGFFAMDAARERLVASVARRVERCIEARASGATLYMEDGEPRP
jgi:8-oxo-dGTP diphosphatase